jgi:hypothetical protein
LKPEELPRIIWENNSHLFAINQAIPIIRCSFRLSLSLFLGNYFPT